MLEHKKVYIEDREIGALQPVYIVFEAGPTHDGLQTAKQLVAVAANAGADAVKFQLLDAEKMVSGNDVMFTYNRLISKETGELDEVTEPLIDILKRRQMEKDEWIELIDYCRERQVTFFSTATSNDELAFLASKDMGTVKICSGDVNYYALIRQAAKYKWSVQLDTGSSSIGEVEDAVDILEQSGCNQIIINHCPSGYPARLESINLRVITTLLKMFPYPVAFSDHCSGCDMDIAAVALGASMIEKTITLDKTIRSPEHIMSLEPDEAASFVKSIRDVEIALGSTRRIVTNEERNQQNIIRRSLFAACDIKKGAKLNQEMLAYSRPGDGIPANMDKYYIGLRVNKDISANTKLCFEDFG